MSTPPRRTKRDCPACGSAPIRFVEGCVRCPACPWGACTHAPIG